MFNAGWSLGRPIVTLVSPLLRVLSAMRPAPGTLIASFAKHVVQEAMGGNRVAKEIISSEAKELAELLLAAGKLLGEEGLPLCVVGGFYEGAKALLKPATLKELSRRVRNPRNSGKR